MSYKHSTLTEAAIIAGFYESQLDEGLGDFLKKAVDKVKAISSTVKTYMLSKADAISAWADKNIVEPLKKHLSSIVPGYSWGSNKTNEDGLITSVIQLLAKSSGIATESREERFSEAKSKRLSEGVKQYMNQVRSSFINEKRTVVESGAIGAVLSVIHWSHFSIDVLEAILKVAPSIPFLAGLVSKLHSVEKFMKSNPKLSKALDWYEHGTFTKWNIPVKDAINAICIAVGIVEIIAGGGVWIILSTVGSAAWVIGEKIWHHYQKADKEAAAIKESFTRGSKSRYIQERVLSEFDELDDEDDDDDVYEDDDLEIDSDEEDDELFNSDGDEFDDDTDLDDEFEEWGSSKKESRFREEEDDFEDDEIDLDDEDCDDEDEDCEDEIDIEDCDDDEDCDDEDYEDEDEDLATESRIRRLESIVGKSTTRNLRESKTSRRSRY